MTVIGALSSFRELGEMSAHKRAQVHRFTLTVVVLNRPMFSGLALSEAKRYSFFVRS
jgi:hypothetical protein